VIIVLSGTKDPTADRVASELGRPSVRYCLVINIPLL